MTDADEAVLAINCGASSVKFALLGRAGGRLVSGAVEALGEAQSTAWFRHGTEAKRERAVVCAHHHDALALIFTELEQHPSWRITAAGHRVVHGGAKHSQPVFIDAAVLAELRRSISLAPLHVPASLAGIEAISALYPSLPQVACFDTAFHANLPALTRRLPLPARFDEVRRYGFHGLSYEYVLSTFTSPVPARMVFAHLGNGASLVAVKDGRSIDTTMSFSPTGGLVMGTRSGDLDPSVLIYLARQGLSVDALEQLVDREAGLLALGGSADMKTLLERAPTDAAARLAVELFGYSVRKAIGAFAAALGGLDVLVFTGGIGERAAAIRAEACRGLQIFGVELDDAQNARHDPSRISTEASRTLVKVVTTDEDLMIVKHTRAVLQDLR